MHFIHYKKMVNYLQIVTYRSGSIGKVGIIYYTAPRQIKKTAHTLPILCRYTSIDKGWGTSVLHLGELVKLHGQARLHITLQMESSNEKPDNQKHIVA